MECLQACRQARHRSRSRSRGRGWEPVPGELGQLSHDVDVVCRLGRGTSIWVSRRAITLYTFDMASMMITGAR